MSSENVSHQQSSAVQLMESNKKYFLKNKKTKTWQLLFEHMQLWSLYSDVTGLILQDVYCAVLLC